MGQEYTVYDEHCKTCVAKYSHIVKTERFAKEYMYEKEMTRNKQKRQGSGKRSNRVFAGIRLLQAEVIIIP